MFKKYGERILSTVLIACCLLTSTACSNNGNTENTGASQGNDTADIAAYKQTMDISDMKKSSIAEMLEQSKKNEELYAARTRFFDFMQGDVYTTDSDRFAVINTCFPNADYKGISIEPETVAFGALSGTAGCSFENKVTEPVALDEAAFYAVTDFPHKIWGDTLYVLPTFVCDGKLEEHSQLAVIDEGGFPEVVLTTPESGRGTWGSTGENLGWEHASGVELDMSDITEEDVQQCFRISTEKENRADDVTDKVQMRIANVDVQTTEEDGYSSTGTRVTFAYEKSVPEPVEVAYYVFSKTGEHCNKTSMDTALLFANEGEISIWYADEVAIDSIIYAARYADEDFIWDCGNNAESEIPDVDIYGYYDAFFTSDGIDANPHTRDYVYECRFNEDFQGYLYEIAEFGKGSYIANTRRIKVKAGDTVMCPYFDTESDNQYAKIDEVHLYFKSIPAEEYPIDEEVEYTLVNNIPMYYKESIYAGEGDIGCILTDADVAGYYTSASKLDGEILYMCYIAEINELPYAVSTPCEVVKLADDMYNVYDTDFVMPRENEKYKRVMLQYH